MVRKLTDKQITIVRKGLGNISPKELYRRFGRLLFCDMSPILNTDNVYIMDRFDCDCLVYDILIGCKDYVYKYELIDLLVDYEREKFVTVVQCLSNSFIADTEDEDLEFQKLMKYIRISII